MARPDGVIGGGNAVRRDRDSDLVGDVGFLWRSFNPLLYDNVELAATVSNGI